MPCMRREFWYRVYLMHKGIMKQGDKEKGGRGEAAVTSSEEGQIVRGDEVRFEISLPHQEEGARLGWAELVSYRDRVPRCQGRSAK